MVSKVAVIALVAIVACPILLGYAMNLQETSYTKYEPSGSTVNVSQLLSKSTEYGYAMADAIDLNTKFIMPYYTGSPGMPHFKTVTTTSTALPSLHSVYVDRVPASTHIADDFYNYYMVYDYNPGQNPSDPNAAYVICDILRDDNVSVGVVMVHSVYYDPATDSAYCERYTYGGSPNTWNYTKEVVQGVKEISYRTYGGGTYTGNGEFYRYSKSWTPVSFIDISAGFYLNWFNTNSVSGNTTQLDLPSNPRNLLLTMDLNTITASSYQFTIYVDNSYTAYLTFTKTTDGSGVHWTVTNQSNTVDLYYDQTASSNTYQLYMDNYKSDIRYVGAWPTVIGYANYYLSYDLGNWTPSQPIDLGRIHIRGATPLMRIDASEYRAYEYQIIEDQTYEPGAFKNNPATTISNPSIYGTSISFGGNTYTVTDGNIRLGTHDVPVKNMVFSSILVAGGYYENKIGDTLVSTTVTPSTIVFNGKWSANITTVSLVANNYTKTEWVAGSFGWDGIDHNFLIVGLITSVGAFIAVAIYARTSNKTLWPALIVCAGAAMLFFAML